MTKAPVRNARGLLFLCSDIDDAVVIGHQIQQFSGRATGTDPDLHTVPVTLDVVEIKGNNVPDFAEEALQLEQEVILWSFCVAVEERHVVDIAAVEEIEAIAVFVEPVT